MIDLVIQGLNAPLSLQKVTDIGSKAEGHFFKMNGATAIKKLENLPIQWTDRPLCPNSSKGSFFTKVAVVT